MREPLVRNRCSPCSLSKRWTEELSVIPEPHPDALLCQYFRRGTKLVHQGARLLDPRLGHVDLTIGFEPIRLANILANRLENADGGLAFRLVSSTQLDVTQVGVGTP